MAAESPKPTPDEADAEVFDLQEAEAKYPDYDFVLAEKDMLDGALFSATHDKRLRATMRELGKAGPQFAELAVPSNRRAALDRARKYFNGRITRDGQPIPRTDIIDLAAAENATLEELAAVNHPVAQMVEKLVEDYGGKIPIYELRWLTTSLLSIAAFPSLKRHCQEQLRSNP